VTEKPPSPLRIEREGPVARVWLDRPEMRNAFNDKVSAAIKAAFEMLGSDPVVRVIVLGGTGEHFCAGGDLSWMRATGSFIKDRNVEDARAFVACFAAMDRCVKPVVVRVQGAALGGGAGLVAVGDVAIASASAMFAFPEVRLGIVPAAISPYVVSKIGWSQARRYFLTGERFDAAAAERMGLVHRVVPDAELDAAVAQTVKSLLAGGPESHVRVKRLLKGLNHLSPDGAMLDLTARTLADARASSEGQAGLEAFLAKKTPPWVV
jgi:methylglutaconyl-CoA hydratase